LAAILAAVADRSPTRDFVGRGAELAAVERAVGDARKGVPSVLLVGGDAGIGKSTLIQHGADRAGVALYLGRCVHIGGDVIPLAPLGDLLRQVSRSSPEALNDTPALASLQHWSTPASAAVNPAGISVGVLELLSGLAGADAVMGGIEDLHWADTATWDLFEFLARNLIDEHVVLVGTYRANEIVANPAQRRRLAELTRLPAVHPVHLGGLGRHEVATRVAAIIGGPAPAALVEEVLARGQGNPFFTEELVAAHLAGEAIPALLSDLISADIAGLDDRSRSVLVVAATIGREISHRLLKRVANLDDEAVEAAIRAATDAQLMVVDTDSDAYRFRHPLIGEVAYRELLPSQRRRLHRLVADALQEQLAPALAGADAAGELAFHLDRAGDQARAFVALLAAADAAEMVAPAAALRHLERAFELWDHVGETATAGRRAERMWQAAELASGTVGAQRAVELARAAFAVGAPARGEAFGHERLGRYLWTAGDHERSAVEFERAARLLAAGDAGPARASTFAGLGQAELMLGHYQSAELWCHKAFELVPTPGADPQGWVLARRVLGLARSALGYPEQAAELCQEAAAAATSAHTRTFASMYLAQALLDAGRCQDAVNLALDTVADAQLTGLERNFGAYLDALAAEGLTRLGHWSEADIVLARHPGVDQLLVANIRLGRAGAMLAARRGDSDRARAFLAMAEAQPLDPWHQAVFDSGAADVHLILGEWDRAAAAAERGWDSTHPHAPLWSARFAMLTAGAAVEQALDARARRDPIDGERTVAHLQQRIDAARAAQPSDANGGPAVDAAAHLAYAAATLTRLTGPDPDAWADAAHRWQQLSDPWATASARLRETEAAVSTGAAARAAVSLHEAHRIASELGARPLLTEIDAVSRRTRLSVEAPPAPVIDETSINRLGLTPREAEVLSLVAAGQTNRRIGEALYISEKTVSVHVSNLLRKLGVTSRVDAAAIAQRLGVS
jgi:DNA-binding CsgD family transcriptional regulator/tetratricopeptide (TPR) repeat protein